MKLKNNGRPDPGPLPDYKPTECVHCGEKFSTLSRIPIIGEPPSAGFSRFCQNLVGHLASKHPEETQAAVMEAATLTGWMYLRHFRSYDPEMIRQMDETRHRLHARTRMVTITDEKIIQKVFEIAVATNMDIAADHREALINLFKEFRDLYEERGLHPPTQAGPKLMV